MEDKELFLIRRLRPGTLERVDYAAVLIERKPVDFESYVYADDMEKLSAACRRKFSPMHCTTPVRTVSSYVQVDGSTLQAPCNEDEILAFLRESSQNGFLYYGLWRVQIAGEKKSA